MKTHLIFLFTLVIVAVSNDASAQSGRRMRNTQPMPESQKQKPEKIDYIQLTLNKLDETLVLDSFQEAIIKQELERHQVQQQRIIESDIPDESKKEQLQVLNLKFDENVTKILAPEQIVKYQDMKKKKKGKK